MQKFLTLRNGLVAPIQKARISVSDVMVTEIAEDLNVSEIRSSTGAFKSVCLQPDMRINISSTPTPEISNHFYINFNNIKDFYTD